MLPSTVCCINCCSLKVELDVRDLLRCSVKLDFFNTKISEGAGPSFHADFYWVLNSQVRRSFRIEVS